MIHHACVNYDLAALTSRVYMPFTGKTHTSLLHGLADLRMKDAVVGPR